MATTTRIGKTVRITGGMREFVGKIGTIVGIEDELYRVRLRAPVEIPNVGMVHDDLWDGEFLVTIREG